MRFPCWIRRQIEHRHSLNATVRRLRRAVRSTSRWVLRSVGKSEFPWLTTILLTITAVVALLFIPSFNAPATGTVPSDRLEIEVQTDGADAIAQLEVIRADAGSGLVRADLWITSDAPFTGPVSVRAYTEKAGLLQGCMGGDSMIERSEVFQNWVGDELIESSEVSFSRRESASVRCALDPARVYATDGAVTLVTIPGLSLRAQSADRRPRACLNLVSSGLILNQRNVCDSYTASGTGYFASDAIWAGYESTAVSTLAQSRETTRAMIFGLLLGIAGGFLATLVVWIERSSRRSPTRR